MKKNYSNYLMIALLAAGLTLLALFAPIATIKNNSGNTVAPEILKIKSLKSVEEQSTELKKLLERVGPLEAQEQMFRSGLPFTGQTHLLVHVIGDYVYDNLGQKGLASCKDYFLSACYHGFIINTLGDSGLPGLVEVMESCNEALPGVASQCAHGSGHGFVAWHDYDLVKALEMCDELGSKVSNFGYFNCYDGVFMENFWGVHNGTPSEKRWIKEGDINYPCNDPRIAEKYLTGCWANQATLIYQYYKGDLRKTAQACDVVAKEEYRNSCYNNLYRQIHPLTAGSKDKVLALCQNVISKDRQDECVLTNMSAYWGVGDRKVPYEICDIVVEPLKNSCFERLSNMVGFYYNNSPKDKELYCSKISSTLYRNKCLGNKI